MQTHRKQTVLKRNQRQTIRIALLFKSKVVRAVGTVASRKDILAFKAVVIVEVTKLNSKTRSTLRSTCPSRRSLRLRHMTLEIEIF